MTEQFDVTPEVVELDNVTEEVVTPQETGEVEETETVATEEVEPTPTTAELELKERNAWFAERRRELEAKEKSWQEQLENFKKQNEELMTFKQQQEAQAKDVELRKLAEDNGWDYDDLKKQVEKEERYEQLEKKLAEKEAREKELEEKLAKTSADRELEKMYLSDKEALRSLDPTLDIDKLPEQFFQLRVAGVDVETALLAAKAKMNSTESAPKIGKVNGEKPDTYLLSEADWDNLSPAQKQKLLDTDFERVEKSQATWR